MKFEKLEALRGLAAFYVVLHHSIPHSLSAFGLNFGILLRFGQEAVILFFIISGFVINYSFQKSQDKNFNLYLFKRSARIYIPLFFIYALGYIAACIKSGSLEDPEIWSLILNILMLQDISSLKPGTITPPYMGNNPLWSLSYEWWFYIMYFPIQKYITSKKKQNIFILLTAVGAAMLYIWSPNFFLRIFMYMSIWWAGVSISNLVIEGRKITLQALSPALLPVAGVTLITLVNIEIQRSEGTLSSIGAHPLLEMRHHAFAFIAILIALAWKNLNWALFRFLIAPFALLAPISYVIYISHHYLVASANYLSFINNRALELAGYLAVLLIFSWALEKKAYPIIYRKLNKSLLPYIKGRIALSTCNQSISQKVCK